MKKLEKTKFFVIAIFALAILLASCGNTAGDSSPGTNSSKSVLDTPQTALRNIPLTGELINDALGKTSRNPSIRSASAFSDVKDGLEDYTLMYEIADTEVMMAILKFDFSKMDFWFGDIYRIPSNFDYSQETRNYLRNQGGDYYLSDNFRNFFRNAFFQIVKYSPTIVYCYFKPNGVGSDAGSLIKLSENITGKLDVEFFNIPKSNHYMYEKSIESNGKTIVDGYYSESGKSSYSKSIIDNINSYWAYYDGGDTIGNTLKFKNKSVFGRTHPLGLIFYATSDGRAVGSKSVNNNYFLKYLTLIKNGLKLDGETWKWGNMPATEIKNMDNRDGKKVYYVEESDLSGNFSVPESTKNIITTLDAKFAEMGTEINKPGFFLSGIPNEAGWKKQLADWLATL